MKRKAMLLVLTEAQMRAVRSALKGEIESPGTSAEARVLVAALDEINRAWDEGSTTHAAALKKLTRA